MILKPFNNHCQKMDDLDLSSKDDKSQRVKGYPQEVESLYHITSNQTIFRNKLQPAIVFLKVENDIFL